jgi:hypothetical protein
MNVPIDYVFSTVMILGGLVTAWLGPNLKDADDPPTGPSPRKKLFIRIFGVGLVVGGIILLRATILGIQPPPGGDGPLF